jgi:F0F1-type ATP synthase membrane subunit c/vacuolar-type H+-ATPase subunit K
MFNIFAETATEVVTTVASSGWSDIQAKAVMMSVSLAGAALGLGLFGFSYMKALGRNPEAGKAASQVIIIAAMIELTALLGFLSGTFLLK